MHINKLSSISFDPFISHMRIAWQDSIRKDTEEYWRSTIAQEVFTKFPYAVNIEVVAKEIRKNNESPS